MFTTKYKYNANDDAIDRWQQNFTSRIGDGSGDPEEEFLSYVRLITELKPDATWLEIGCGLGRMVQIIKTKRNAVIGLEPDPARYSDCRKRFRFTRKVDIFNTNSSDYKNTKPGRKFDLILCSMVLQHVSTRICEQILADIHDLLSEDGIAVISTTQNCKELFTFQDSPNLQTHEEFDEYAENSPDQKFGIPVRKFTRESLSECFGKSKLSIVHWGQFSYIRPEKLAWFAGRYQMDEDTLRDVADSQYAIVRKN